MKALSLTQPWASLVAIGAKQIETRSWSTAYRALAKIHHPDVGGDESMFKRLRMAYDKGIARFK